MLNIHKRLFVDVFDGAGVYRDYNFTKKEWVLNGDTVTYASYETIKETLEYDFYADLHQIYGKYILFAKEIQEPQQYL